MFYISYPVNKTEIDGFKVTTSSGTNVLGLVVFSVVLGVILGQMGEAGRPVKAFMDSLQEAVIKMVKLIIWLVGTRWSNSSSG